MKNGWMSVLVFWNIVLTLGLLWLGLRLWDQSITVDVLWDKSIENSIKADSALNLVERLADATVINSETMGALADNVTRLQTLVFDSADRITAVWGEIIDIRMNGP